jgi:lipid A 3-O-deacylase
MPLLATAISPPHAVRISVGKGKPNQLHGGRLALDWDWSDPLLSGQRWQLTGAWQASVAYWQIHDKCTGCDTLFTLAAAPSIRWQYQPEATSWRPYIEASVGPALLSNDQLGDRNLGDKWAFQDLLGTGVLFGKRQQFDLSWHYLHYSNANIIRPNRGIDVKYLVSLAYHFE